MYWLANKWFRCTSHICARNLSRYMNAKEQIVGPIFSLCCIALITMRMIHKHMYSQTLSHSTWSNDICIVGCILSCNIEVRRRCSVVQSAPFLQVDLKWLLGIIAHECIQAWFYGTSTAPRWSSQPRYPQVKSLKVTNPMSPPGMDRSWDGWYQSWQANCKSSEEVSSK